MPLYVYACKVCGKNVDVIQDHDKQAPPTEEEGGRCISAEVDRVSPEHAWVKRIFAPKLVRARGWGGSKGNW